MGLRCVGVEPGMHVYTHSFVRRHTHARAHTRPHAIPKQGRAFIPLPQRSIVFGLVPTDLLLMIPPSHSLQPIVHPTDIHKHVCPLRQAASVPFRHAHAAPPTFPYCGCHTSGELPFCPHLGSRVSIAFRGLGEMRILWAFAIATTNAMRMLAC